MSESSEDPLDYVTDLCYGTLVSMKGLVSKPEHNGQWGVVEGQDVVSKRCMVRKYKGGNTMLSIARKNLKVETGCSGHADKFLEVWPVEAAKIKEGAAIPVSALFGGSPDIPDSEAKEKEFLKKPQKFVKNSPRAGWKDPVGLKAYTKKAAYPNLYFYFDASDTSSNVNQFATSLSPYNSSLGNKFPRGGIRFSISSGEFFLNYFSIQR